MDVINAMKSCVILPSSILGGWRDKAAASQKRVGKEEYGLE